MSNLLFFDIPTAIGVPTSPNTWKVRLVLNFKRLEYRTRWVPIADIASVCKTLHIPPTGTKPGPGGAVQPLFTLPALIDYSPPRRLGPGPIILSDSTPIIQYLDQNYPSPTLGSFPSPHPPLFTNEAIAFHRQVFGALLERIVVLVYPLLTLSLYQCKVPSDKLVFRAKTERRLGRTLEQAELTGQERINRWLEVERAFQSLARFFKDRHQPYLLGNKKTYCDFELVAWLLAFKLMSPTEAWGTYMAKWDGGRWLVYLSRFNSWMTLPDHDEIMSYAHL